jgi:uncharacterized protein DUF4157
MSLISQQVTKPETAKAAGPVVGAKEKVRGLAGNHTLIGGPFLQRKCACGGQGGKCDCKKPEERMVQRALQKKLAVSEAGDRYEQEADRVAQQVLTASFHPAVESTPPRIQRFTGPSNESTVTAPSSVDRVLSGPGRPLDSTLQQSMGHSFGYDFSRVRVHSSPAAAQSARDVNAHAYTVGQDIVFGPGQFAPATNEGRRLIAHELTHVVQQSGTAGPAMSTQVQRKVVDDDDHVTCRSTRDHSVSDLIAAEDKAARLADRAAAAIRKHPPDESTHTFMWSRFRLDYNQPRDRCQFIREIADRFDRIAHAIRNTETMYWCTGAGEPMDLCKGHFARTYAGEKIALCSLYWDLPDEQATTLLHEWAHWVYESLNDDPPGDEPAGGFDMAECYANFANEIFGDPVTVFEGIPACVPKDNPPALDPANLRLPCPRIVSLNISTLGGFAFGLPGSSHYMTGFGLDVVFPLTRMQDLELAVGGKYRRFAPTDPDDRYAFMGGVHAGLTVLKEPWRFGKQYGAYIEGGLVTTGAETDPYGAVGISGGFHFPVGRQMTLQILAELEVGKTFAADERSFKWAQIGVNVVLQKK